MSRNKKNKIAAIQKLFTQREQATTAQFVASLEKLRAEQTKNEDMQAFLTEYRGRYRTGTRLGMPAGLVKGWRRFLASLENASEIQQKQAQKAEKNLEVHRADVVASRLAVRAGERLEQRLEITLARLTSRGERRELDELTRTNRSPSD